MKHAAEVLEEKLRRIRSIANEVFEEPARGPLPLMEQKEETLDDIRAEFDVKGKERSLASLLYQPVIARMEALLEERIQKFNDDDNGKITCPSYRLFVTQEGVHYGIFATCSLNTNAGIKPDQTGVTVDELCLEEHPAAVRINGLLVVRSNRHSRAGIEPKVTHWVKAVELTNAVRVRYWFNFHKHGSLTRGNKHYWYKVEKGVPVSIDEKEYSEISSKYNAEQDKRTVGKVAPDYT